ncbi:hypothetical protein E4T39_01065 [Aureobasidium subglaciale]|nr:hypothetical protein E4T39_01065 [Aureobasidium subglaciale]
MSQRTPSTRKSVTQEGVTSILPAGDIPIHDSKESWNQDEETLAALGYKPEFKREFNLWTTFCVSFAVLVRYIMVWGMLVLPVSFVGFPFSLALPHLSSKLKWRRGGLCMVERDANGR